MSGQKAPVSPVIEFIKVLNEMSARYGRSELWYDYIDMHAIALANTCDLRCRDTREEQYNAIVQKYDEKTVQQFAELTAITMTALLENPEQDFLGTVYHNLGLSKSQAGQFFTPYNVGQMMARINMPDSLVLDKSRILRVNDPCCGAGCLLLAGYNVMREQLESTDPDWDKYVLFVAQDIDPLVCKMCYIQMCCIGVPGVVVVAILCSRIQSSHQQIFGLRISILLWTRKPLKIHTNKQRSDTKCIWSPKPISFAMVRS